MKNILVTGGAGFIGSNFIRYILETQPETNVTNLDLLTYAGSLENLKDLPDPERYKFIQGDICDRKVVDTILKDNDIDLIIHFAAESHVDRSILEPGAFIRTNIQGTFNLLEAVKKYWTDDAAGMRKDVRFHHVSTDEVYGTLGTDDPPFSEETQISPNSPYAASKAASDHLVQAYFHTYGLPITISNCSNNYGPNQFPEKLIPLMILNALNGKPLPIYGDGGQIRDWLFVEDHCRAIWTVITDGQAGEVFNVGGENQPTNLEIVDLICGTLDQLLPDSPNVPHSRLIAHVKDRPGHDRRYAMNINKIKETLSWQPRISLHEGLKKTIIWYLNNLDWIDEITQESDYSGWEKTNYQGRDNQ